MSYGFYDPENTNRKPVLEVNVYNQRSRIAGISGRHVL